jgi:hypothetical protein
MSSFVPNTSTTTPGNNNDSVCVASTEHSGYPTLAWLMSSYPDNAFFRRFGELNLLNLLRLQTELQEMEQQLKLIRKDAESRDATRAWYEKDFRAMRNNKELGGFEQYKLLIQTSLKHQEYSTHEL